jgi:hypothetical protein
VNYAVDDRGRIVFRAARGSKLYVADNEDAPVAFEVDEFDTGSGRGVAVVAHGPMREVVDLIEIRRLRDLGITPYADAVERDRWVRIEPRSLDGWVFGEPQDPPSA